MLLYFSGTDTLPFLGPGVLINGFNGFRVGPFRGEKPERTRINSPEDFNYYPQTKLWESNVFTSVCQLFCS